MRGFKPWARGGLAALLPCVVLIASCGSPIGDGTRLSALRIQSGGGADQLTTPECITSSLTAIGTFSGDGDDTQANMSGRVKWSSSDPDVVYVGNGRAPGIKPTDDGVYLPSGQVVGLKPGHATIFASFSSVYTAQISVTVGAIDALRIIPDDSVLTDVGEHTSVALELQGRLEANQPWTNITALTTWRIPFVSDQGSFAGPDDGRGNFVSGIFIASNSQPNDPITVEARLPGCGRTAQKQLYVTPIDSLNLTYESDLIPGNSGAGTLTMPLGFSDMVHVMAHFARAGSVDQEISGLNKAFNGVDAAISGQVSITDNSAGILSALPSLTGVTIGAAGTSGTGNLTVALSRKDYPTLTATTKNYTTEQAVLQSILVTPQNQTIVYPDTGFVSATGTFDDGVIWPLMRFITWTAFPSTVSVQNVGAVDTPTGTVTPLTIDGTITDLTASITNSDGVSISQLINVTVTPKP